MKAIFITLLSLWILLSIFNVLYNTKKAISEYHEWAHLTDSEKRHKIFGDFYDFLILIQSHTKPTDHHILIYSDDVKTHFLGIYYLYPRDFVDTNNKESFLKFANTKKFNYIAEYDHDIPLNDYKKETSLSENKTSHKGTLYQLK